MSVARVLLIADPPAGPKIRDHVAAYASCALVRPKDFRSIPVGTRWVLVMNMDGSGTHPVFNEARRMGVTPIPIPPGWSHIQARLTSAGFFNVEAPPRAVAALTHRPLAVLAARSAPPTEPPPKEEPMPSITVETTPVVMSPPAVTPSPMIAGRPFTLEEQERGMQRRREALSTRVKSKLGILRLVFDRNPDATIHEALEALRTMSLDGRGMATKMVTHLRAQIRVEKGLPPIEGSGGYSVAMKTAVLATKAMGLALPPSTTSPPPPPQEAPPLASAGPPRYTLPPDVEAAARLLREALEAAKSVAEFSLAFTAGEKAKIRWRPVVNVDTEV